MPGIRWTWAGTTATPDNSECSWARRDPPSAPDAHRQARRAVVSPHGSPTIRHHQERLMNGLRRRTSFRSLVSSVSAVIVLGALSGAAAFAARSVPSEPLIGGVTADEYAAQMGALHARLVADMPAGTLDQAVVVRLSAQEQKDL